MPKYEVTLVKWGRYSATYDVVVEAEDKDKAVDKAWNVNVSDEIVEYDFDAQDFDVEMIKEIK